MTYTVIGPDYSVWDDNNSTPQQVNFNKAVQAGAPFCFIKSSQSTWMDSDLLYNWSNAKAAGLLRGAYHFLTYDTSPISQADYMWSLLKNDDGELPLVADFEFRSSGLTRSTASSALKMFVERLTQLSGRKPMIYTSPGYWNEFGTTDSHWLNYPLHLAHYTTGTPIVPMPWRSWFFWQFTDRGDGLKYGSEALGVDLNYWYGTLEQLYQFAGTTPPPQTWEVSIDAWARTMGYTGVRP